MGDHGQTCTLVGVDRGRALRVPSVVVTVTQPDGRTIEARLEMRPVVVGSSPDCDLVVVDSQVSRRHCELRLTGQGVELRDLGSKNGTLVGLVSIREAMLPPSIPVTVGSSELRVTPRGTPTVVPMSLSDRFGDAIGQSFAMRVLFAKLERAAASDETILLLGESGTGKEVLARAVHDNSSRKDGPFVIFDCGSIAPNLVETELFGHARGAYTGASAARAGLLEEVNGGTLFIDEIGELPLDLQPKLLRALEARQFRRVGSNEWRPFDTRIIAATHRDLRTRVVEGAFREDLYYRLAVVELRVPALRERKEDIPAIVELFLGAHDPARSVSDLPPHAIPLLLSYDWPGNVRELRNVTARLVLFPEFVDELTGSVKKTLPDASRPEASPMAAPAEEEARPNPLLEIPLPQARDMVMEQFERSYLTAALQRHGGNISRAAEAMGVSRQLVHRLLDRYGLRAK